MYLGSTSKAVENSFLISSGILEISDKLPSKYFNHLSSHHPKGQFLLISLQDEGLQL
jgi:hypothetical protein